MSSRALTNFAVVGVCAGAGTYAWWRVSEEIRIHRCEQKHMSILDQSTFFMSEDEIVANGEWLRSNTCR